VRRAMLSTEQQEARAKNAVAGFLFRQLIVPKVFFDAPWPNRNNRVDVLAVDRSGSGEIHVVEVRVGTSALKDIGAVIAHLNRVPAHFKYLALFDNKNYRLDERMLYAPDGMGRVGIIQVQEDGAGNLSAEFHVRPERFGLDSSVFKLIDRFTAGRQPNIEIRP
jgi:hypothetical protein